MKKILYPSLLVCTTLSLSSCAATPGAVVKDYYDVQEKLNLSKDINVEKTCKSLATEETYENCVKEYDGTGFGYFNSKIKVDVTDVAKDGKTATVTYTLITEHVIYEGNEPIELTTEGLTMEVYKEGLNWRIAY